MHYHLCAIRQIIRAMVFTCICSISGPIAIAQGPPAGNAGQNSFVFAAFADSIIRITLNDLMQQREMQEAERKARIAAHLRQISDSVAAHFSLLTQTPAGNSSKDYRKRTAEKISGYVIGLLQSNANLWRALLARDYSDRILSFHTDVQVLVNGLLRVKETIVVFNGSGEFSPDIDYGTHPDPNNDIQRGIVRDFPTIYMGKDGFWQSVGFTLESITQNNKAAVYTTTPIDNGVRILIGSENVYLDPGIYTYTITYTTGRQLIYHADKHELYWNVNGNGWVFSADSVSCTVHFPFGSRLREYACYTGVQGSTSQFCNAVVLRDSIIHFFNNQPLGAWEGLTVAAAIAPGIITPEGSRSLLSFVRDNYGIAITGGGLLFLFFFYGLFWWYRGRDPQKGVVYPQFSPPPGLSPADVGYIKAQQFSPHLFAATLVDMAVHKMLLIEVETRKFIFSSKVYQFGKPIDGVQHAGFEMESKYGFSPDDLYGQTASGGTYNPTLKKCFDGLRSALEKRFKVRGKKRNTMQGMFIRNDGVTAFGWVLTIILVIAGIAYTVSHYSPQIAMAAGAVLIVLVTMHLVFVSIMRAYTPEGRKTADAIEGFKMYLETAEQQMLAYGTPPEKTLALFEKFLPYAIALKVENAWADKFEDVLAAALQGGYRPCYFYGGSSSVDFGRGFNAGSFAHGLSAGLSSTTASASTPPSSSSGGSSGGGSSGGGGGGGGGGGW